MGKRIIPNGFVEYETNEIVFDDHVLSFECESLSLVSEWTITIEIDGKGSWSRTYVQEHEDSAKYRFYEEYKKLCKEICIVPAAIE